MPEAFENCIKAGGKVWTEKRRGNRYIHKCYINGKVYSGEVKTKKSKDGKH